MTTQAMESMSTLMVKIKVFIIDRQPILRQGLASVVESDTDFEVVGEAANVEEALLELGNLQPNIVIMDAFKTGSGGIDAINLIREKFPEIKVIILTDSNKDVDFLNAIKAGAKGYLSKSLGPAELTDSARLVAVGGAVVYSSMGARLFGGPRAQRDKNGFNCLSDREREILTLVARGHKNKEIAAITYVSETTVKSHLRRILEKLNVKNRAQAVAIAMEQGLLSNYSNVY